MKISKYKILTDKKGITAKFAVVSDLHARPYKSVLRALQKISPDVILLPGDIVEISAAYMDKRNQNGLRFLEEAVKIAPCYYCYGNHEIFYSHAKFGHSKTPDKALGERYVERIKACGVYIINDDYMEIPIECGGTSEKDKILVGGLVCGRDMDPALNMPEPDLRFLSEYDKAEGFKILLCHYPHYYNEYLADTSIDLALSGHAHGGQWRIFGRGVFAPHQGLFPKFTSGMHDGRHIISRGSANNVKPIPRFFNPCEVLEIEVCSK